MPHGPHIQTPRGRSGTWASSRGRPCRDGGRRPARDLHLDSSREAAANE